MPSESPSEKLDSATGSLGKVARDVNSTAKAWELAAKATGEVARDFEKMKESSKPKESFDIEGYRAVAEQTSQAANDIRNLLTAIDDFSVSGNYSRIMNALTLRAVIFVLCVFIMGVVYRIVSARLPAGRSGSATDHPEEREASKRRR